MKYFITLSLLCVTIFSFGQMSLSEIIKVNKMDMDQFETYAISKGYEFHKFQKDENYNGQSYVKGTGKSTKYLTLYDSYFSYGTNVTYQTSSSTELLNIKNQLKSLGFNFFNSGTSGESQYKEYKNSKYELSIYTIPPDEEDDAVKYEINLHNLY